MRNYPSRAKALWTAALSACLFGTAAAKDYSEYGIDEDVPGPGSYETIDGKDYSGRKLTIITHAVPVIGEPTALHAEQFQELTGADVEVVHVPFGDLFQRIMIPFQTVALIEEYSDEKAERSGAKVRSFTLVEKEEETEDEAAGESGPESVE